MLVAVEAPRTQSTDAVKFVIKGESIPPWLVDMIKTAYPKALVKEDDLTEDALESDWFKEIREQMMPAGNLRNLRQNFGITQQELANRAGVSKQQISAMERGKDPIGRKMAKKLADALGTSVSNLFW